MRTPDPMVCSMEAALKIIGEKWALVALREITFGSSRFSDILASTGAPRDILAARLKSLEAAGVIHRELYEQRPPRYDYLPFFSRLTLMQTVRDLNRLGFTKIALARVPVEEPST